MISSTLSFLSTAFISVFILSGHHKSCDMVIIHTSLILSLAPFPCNSQFLGLTVTSFHFIASTVSSWHDTVCRTSLSLCLFCFILSFIVMNTNFSLICYLYFLFMLFKCAKVFCRTHLISCYLHIFFTK